jgi:hypothetical protein
LMRLITQNLGWKLLSLLAAFVVWINVAGEPERATIVSIPVEYSNFPKDLVISSEIAGRVRIEARGQARQLHALSDSGVAAVIDLATVKGPGERTFTLTASDLDLPRGVELIRTIPSQLRFRFERQTTRMLEIDVPFAGTLPRGLSIGEKTFEPEQLRVSGPESHVSDARRLVSDPFDLSRVTGDRDETLAVYTTDPELQFLSVPQVKVRIRVKRTH